MAADAAEYLDRITQDPDIMVGKPVVRALVYPLNEFSPTWKRTTRRTCSKRSRN